MAGWMRNDAGFLKQCLNGIEMTIKQNDMKRMIIDVVRRLAGGKLAQQATQTRMSAAGHDVARSEVSLCQRKGTLVPTIGNRFAIGLARLCHRLGMLVSPAWHSILLPAPRLPFPPADHDDPWGCIGEWGGNNR